VDISPTHHFDVYGREEIVGRIRAWVSSIAGRLGADERATADIVLAVSEAATNAVRHAYLDAQEYHLTLKARRIGERIVVRVRDYGSKFDPATIRLPDMGGVPRVGGYGIYLMRRVMDHVYYMASHPNGMELILVRRRNTA